MHAAIRQSRTTLSGLRLNLKPVKRCLRWILFLLILPAASGQEPDIPGFIDLLITGSSDIRYHTLAGEHAEISDVQDAIDDMPERNKLEGVLLRFDPETVPLTVIAGAAEAVYRCGVPAVFLLDATIRQPPELIRLDPYLNSLSRMPGKSRFLRLLDLSQLHGLPASAGLQADIRPEHYWIQAVRALLSLLIPLSGWIAGILIVKSGSKWWSIVYIIPALAAVMIATARLSPVLEMHHPFRMIMKGRIEYILMALSTAMLISIPAARLANTKTSILSLSLAGLFVINFTVQPFITPLFNRNELLSLTTSFDRFGVCLQGTAYTCGPAAAVTALKELNIHGGEGEIAAAAASTAACGTSPDLLSKVLDRALIPCGFRAQYAFFDNISDIKQHLPVIAVMRLGIMTDHFVTVLRVTDSYIAVADPAAGLRIVSPENFRKEWRSSGIIFVKSSS